MRNARLLFLVLAWLSSRHVLGDELVFESHTWTKFSSNFTPVVQTTPTALYSFNASACSETYNGSAQIAAPATVTGTVNAGATEFVADAPFAITATFNLAYTAAPRNPPSNPAAGYRVRLETRESIAGTLKCKRESDAINVDAGTHNVSMTQTCSIDRASLFAGAHLRTEFNITTFNQTGICGYTIYSETHFDLPPPADLKLSVIDPNCATATHCDADYLEPDPATSFATMRPVQDRTALTTAAVTRTGVVADGVTYLLLRASVPESAPPATTVTFELLNATNSAADGKWGVLMKRDATAPANQVTVPADHVSGGKRWAFALYRAPLDHPTPSAINSTSMSIRAFSSAKPDEKVTSKVRLLSPPVVLVHGVWSDGSAWKPLEPPLENAGFRVCNGCLPDYGTHDAAPNFDPLEIHSPESRYVSDVVIGGINAALKEDRTNGIAATQVDGIGHSMGGVVLRARMAIPSNGGTRDPLRPNNMLKGDLHKIITVGSPHKGSTLVNWLIEHQCDTVQLRALNPPTIGEVLATMGKPIKGAIYGFQTASRPLQNIGRTLVPAHAIVGIAPPESQTEEALKTMVRLNTSRDPQGNPWDFDTIGKGEGKHDTIVNDYSQLGGIAFPDAITTIQGIVHADVTGKNDIGETESPAVWERVIQLLRDPIDKSFTIFQQHVPDPNDPVLGDCTQSRAPKSLAGVPRATALTATITPPSGTVVRPGSTVMVTLSAPGAQAVEGALFIAGDQAEVVSGSGPFTHSWVVPAKKAGRVDVHLWTFGKTAENYGGDTYVLVQSQQAPASLSVTPSEVSLTHRDARVQLIVTGNYPDSSSLRVTSGTAGTTYTTLSGNASVIRVSADGLIEPVATGSDSVRVTNSGVSVVVPVTVSINTRRRAARK
jgi:hypothetical protein